VNDAGRSERARAHWRSNRRLMAALLVVWFVVPYGLGIVFVEPLNRYHLGGFPLGFWFAQQGAIYVFVVLIAIYAVAMDRIDRRFEENASPQGAQRGEAERSRAGGASPQGAQRGEAERSRSEDASPQGAQRGAAERSPSEGPAS
jgi:putative solute:sodium symporter small subunit